MPIHLYGISEPAMFDLLIQICLKKKILLQALPSPLGLVHVMFLLVILLFLLAGSSDSRGIDSQSWISMVDEFLFGPT